MNVTITDTPQDIYVLAGFTAGNDIQLQNQSKEHIRVYAGTAQPALKKDYFVVKPDEWIPISGSAVIFAWCPRPVEIVVQEGI